MLALASLAGCTTVTLVLDDAARPRAGVGWVGLYSTALVEWLENENRLVELCAEFAADVGGLDRCHREKREPRQVTIPVRRAPDPQAAPIGSLLVIAAPGQGLSAFYVPRETRAAVPLVPDLFDRDWGYGPHFHHTFLDRRGDWFLLPEGPFPTAVWIRATDLGMPPDVRRLEPGEVVTTPRGDLVIVQAGRGSIRARPEQPADMWCQAGDPPALTRSPQVVIPMHDLYTATGHLRVRPKYLRGC